MSRGVNRVTLLGNLGNDPDAKFTQGGTAVTKISLATTSSRKNKDGEFVDYTEWHRVTFFGKLGEIAGEYLRKGSQCYVEGEIRYSKYTGSDGVEKYSTDIIATELRLLGGGSGERQERPPPRPQDRGRPASTRQAPSRQAPAEQEFEDDDIQF